MAKDSSAKKIRVLHITKWYPNKNDVQNGVFVQKHILAASQHCEVKVLAWLPGNNETVTQESHESGLAVTRTWFKARTPISAKRHIFIDYINSHYNNKNLPDLLHLHVFSPDLLVAVLWAKRKQIPVVISEHWSGYARGNFSKMPKWRKWAYKRLAKVNRVLPVSKFLQSSMQACDIQANYRIVPNVVDKPSTSINKQSAFSFVVIADLVDDIKNITGIIKAFNAITTGTTNIELHIIGGGPDEALLKSVVAKSKVAMKINLHGRLANQEVQQLLPTFDVLVLNSYVETFGVVLLEAHAAGLPAIVTHCGGPDAWEEPGDIFIEPGNHNQLVAAMQTMIERGRQNLHFTKWQACLPYKVGEVLNEIYHEVIQENSLDKAKRKKRNRTKNL